ncbi:MAG TPA: TonB-dependent receptor, partial [Flavisolibacter sp.]|nr:TonB-dependent receptor [Flavisolibacter sp.]
MLKRLLLLLTLAFLSGQVLFAQVTTSSVSGQVKSGANEPLVGATIVLTHEPTGTVYRAVSRSAGRFDVQNITPGGPYNIRVSFVGFGEFTRGDINVPLGERFEVLAELTTASQQLQDVTVTARRSATERTGASTNISRRQIQNLPNIGRSITSLTRNTPQSNGNSFAGMNYRYNNITIDGALFNNNFGRSGDGQIPGGGISAISIDALDQVQVNIAPYDVRQAGFVGAGINAVTRRGTNTFFGTAYGFYRNQNFNGERVRGQRVQNDDRSTSIYGASVGGPIIKNKLFFFVNAEREKRTLPGQIWRAQVAGNEGQPNVAPVLASDLDRLATHLKSTYGFNPGAYQGYDFAVDNFKFVTRLDWNITDKHRFTVRYNQSETNEDDRVNATSGPNSVGGTRRGGPQGGLNFNSSNFKNNTLINSIVTELNSTFTNRFSNQLIGSFTHNQPKRIANSNFPFVDIMNSSNSANVYTSFGTDLFSYNNAIDDKAFNIANNATFNLGKHVVTAGASYDYLTFANDFSDYGGPSYYRYASVDDFINNAAPIAFAVTYGYDPKNPGNIPPAAANFGQVGVYAQDAWAVNNKFKLTYGLRVDKPLYTFDAPKNPALAAVVFKDENGNNEQFDVSQWPKSRLLWSPRVGFTYDVEGDRNIVVRGGTGIFTGRIPFIWLVNQVADNGVLRSIYNASTAELATIRFSTDRNKYLPTTIPTPGTAIPGGQPPYSATAADFRMPQVWRSNLAFDKKLGRDYTFTLEGVFTKYINNVYFRNANLGTQNGVLANPGDNRPYYNRRLNNNINTMTVMDNTNKGFSTALTAQVQKAFSKNWEGFVAYTYTVAQDINIGTSDRASSSWTTNNIISNPNKPELGQSNFAVPHRIVGNFSYKFNYLNDKMATTIGLYYSAASQERYHYRYNSDVNGDGNSNDILFIPADPTQITFVEGFKVGSNTYTAKQQSDAFFAFIENDPYLRKHKGQYMERYGATLPWQHNLDLRILQDFSLNALGRKHT